jgi:hypothetical protein
MNLNLNESSLKRLMLLLRKRRETSYTLCEFAMGQSVGCEHEETVVVRAKDAAKTSQQRQDVETYINKLR